MTSTEIPVDLDVVAQWMDARGLGDGPLREPTLIAGGTQNVLLRFVRSGRTFVLRRPPVHKRANSDETMRREARVLGALAGSAVPHPGLIAAEPDPEVLGAAFYLMEPVEGFNPTLGLPEPFASDFEWQREMGLSMADAIASLAAVDHVAVGLADLGRFDGWAERQVGRWRKQLDGYSELPGYPGPHIPGVQRVGEWLDGHLPARVEAGIMQGLSLRERVDRLRPTCSGGDGGLGAGDDRRPVARPRPPARDVAGERRHRAQRCRTGAADS
jgi:aminoglycoside phosphotransferase (APT) family kinase protein